MEELQENSKERRNLRVKKCGSYNEGRHSLGGDKRTVQAVACVVRVHSCPHFFIAPPGQFSAIFLKMKNGDVAKTPEKFSNLT